MWYYGVIERLMLRPARTVAQKAEDAHGADGENELMHSFLIDSRENADTDALFAVLFCQILTVEEKTARKAPNCGRRSLLWP